MKNRTIALMSDWGLNDGSVGAVKGVILGINPKANIVDISHDVDSWDIKQGAFLLMAHYRTFPKGTIFMAVIDPGVGTKRKAILVETRDGYFFLGPDNGVLSWALVRGYTINGINVTNEEYFRKPVSSAFHGRDIFAPVAAWLSRGTPLFNFGQGLKSSDIVWAEYPLRRTKNQLIGEVLFIDKFGNAITSIKEDRMKDFVGSSSRSFLRVLKPFKISVRDTVITKLVYTFANGKEGEPLALFGGDFGDLLDIAVYKGSVAKKLCVEVGDKITIERR